MAVIVSLNDVTEQMDLTTDEATAYINRKTGELITLTHEEFALAEDPDEAESAPQWQKELLPKAREVLASEDYIPCRASSRFMNGRSWNALPGPLPMPP
jgi:hypothetical protein